ncbi:hypothetical protein ACAW74_18155 [Fibrella sp. WM1]
MELNGKTTLYLAIALAVLVGTLLTVDQYRRRVRSEKTTTTPCGCGGHA